MRFFCHIKLSIGLDGITRTFIFVRHGLRKICETKILNGGIRQRLSNHGRFVILLSIKTKFIFLVERECMGLQPFPVIEGSAGLQGTGVFRMGRSIRRLKA